MAKTTKPANLPFIDEGWTDKGGLVERTGIAGVFGRALANGVIAHNLSVEASIAHSAIFPHPVMLEPLFVPFDPAQTFVDAGRQCITTGVVWPDWLVQRVILPVLERVDVVRAAGFVASLAGCDAPMSFECIAQGHQASFYLGAPAQHLGFLTSAWLASYPESAIVAAADPWAALPLDAPLVLCDLYAAAPYHRCLRAAVSPWPQLLRLAASLRDGALLFYQVVFAPTVHPWQQNIAGMLAAERSLGRRAPFGQTAGAKNPSEPLFAAVIRIGSTDAMLADSIGALCGIFTAEGKAFACRTTDDYRRAISDAALRDMLQRHASHVTGQLLSASELALLVHPPEHACSAIVGLELVGGLLVPAGMRDPGGRFVGVNHRTGVPVRVFVPPQYNNNTLAIGRSGSGKSAALIHAVVQLALQGQGVGFLDPHGNAADALAGALAGIDPERVEYWDFDADPPLAFNAFSYPHDEEYGRVGAEYGHAFGHLFGAEGFFRMLHILVNAIVGLLILKHNLVSLPVLLGKGAAGESLRQRIIATTTNQSVHRFFAEEFVRFGPEAMAPILNRISPLLLDECTYRIFAQQDTKADLARAMAERKIVLVKTPANTAAASLVGGLLIAQARMAALHHTLTAQATNFHLFIDEVHRFVSSAALLQSIIEETTKYGLGVTLAHQETGQVPTELLKALYSMPNTLVFSVNLPDAKHLAGLFDGRVAPEALASQPVGHVHARYGQDVVSYQSPPPLPSDPALVKRIIARSQERHYATTPTIAPVHRSPRTIESL